MKKAQDEQVRRSMVLNTNKSNNEWSDLYLGGNNGMERSKSVSSRKELSQH